MKNSARNFSVMNSVAMENADESMTKPEGHTIANQHLLKITGTQRRTNVV